MNQVQIEITNRETERSTDTAFFMVHFTGWVSSNYVKSQFFEQKNNKKQALPKLYFLP